MMIAPYPMLSNTAPILALVGHEILSPMAFVGVYEVRVKDIALCESRWALALPTIALAGQSSATYFMVSGADRARQISAVANNRPTSQAKDLTRQSSRLT
jgi:hypothetical protein